MTKQQRSEIMREMGSLGGKRSAKANKGKHAEWGKKGADTRAAAHMGITLEEYRKAQQN